jgi:hypothetical protein
VGILCSFGRLLFAHFLAEILHRGASVCGIVVCTEDGFQRHTDAGQNHAPLLAVFLLLPLTFLSLFSHI